MIRELENRMVGGPGCYAPKHYVELAGSVEDYEDLPAEGVAQGSIALLLDAAGQELYVFVFDEAEGDWVPLGETPENGGGGLDDMEVT